jgi:hypothetical protein
MVWSHVAFTSDGAHLSLYVNGELVDTASSREVAESEGPLYLGCGKNYGYAFEGRLDEVRIYDRALDGGEISATMSPMQEVDTDESFGLEPTEALLAGSINPHGAATTYWFEYGLTKAYGATGASGIEEGEEVLEGNEPVPVAEAIVGLEPETTYHYRLVAASDRGWSVGPDHTLLTPAEPSSVASAPAWHGEVGLNWMGSVERTAAPHTMELVDQSNSKLFRTVIGAPGEDPKGFYDATFRHAAEHGITILPDIVGLPGYGNLIPPQDKGTAVRSNWVKKLQAIVTRYGHGGTFWTGIEEENKKRKENHEPEIPILVPDFWEIWNEPNTGKYGSWPNEAQIDKAPFGRVRPSVYADLLVESKDAITGVPKNGSAKILMGGLLSVRTKRPDPTDKPTPEDHMGVETFIEDVGHVNAYDVLSVHPYAFRGLGKTARGPVGSADVKKVTERVRSALLVARGALDKLGVPGKNTPM